MNIMKTMSAGLVISGLIAVQASAHSGLVAGISKTVPETTVTKAQFKLPFGMSAKKVRRILGRDGYSEIEITYIGIIDAKADIRSCGRRRSARSRVGLVLRGSGRARKRG